jgi:N-acetylmuramoyl-L-alanine amidase
MKSDSALVSAVHPSPNVGERRKGAKARLVILHYTGMASAAKAVHWLAHPDSKVSCHYVVDEEGVITQLVPERLRAWHAGASHWAGETDINSVSIGIEIQNPGHAHGYPDFPRAQMLGVAELVGDIARRRKIAPEGILAHSDVAPGRKIDPGEKFDWGLLALHGVGHWVAPSPRGADLSGKPAEVAAAQRLLKRYGYDVEPTGKVDERTAIVTRAFQLHFRPACTDGRLDAGTLDTLERLLAALALPVSG